jgi:hypothetical protein
MTATRTDAHRPSAPDFDPEGYDFLGAFDLDPEDGNTAERAIVIRRLIDKGYRFAGVHPTGQCDHCGTRIRYEGLLVHVETKRLITVGETCLDNRFSLSAAEFKALRAAAAAKAAATREAHRLHETAQAAVAWLDDSDPVLVELSYAGNGGMVDGNGFYADLARYLFRHGQLTPGQERAFLVSVERYLTAANRAQRARQEAETRQAAGVQAPSGRVTVTGRVERTWTRDGFRGIEYRFRIADDRGFVVISTIPAALFESVDEHRDLIDQRVEFAAALTPTEDDATVAWAKRPTKARLI